MTAACKRDSRAEPLPRPSRRTEADRLTLGRSPQEPDIAAERHLAAVAGSLGWANEAAAREDYRDALGWLQVLEAAGEELPSEYLATRQLWLRVGTRGRDKLGSS
jgi:hypothetical protein